MRLVPPKQFRDRGEVPEAQLLANGERDNQFTFCRLLRHLNQTTGRTSQGRHHNHRLTLQLAAHNPYCTRDRLRVADGGAAKLAYDHWRAGGVQPSRPVAASTSAFNTAPPAAPRMVLCPIATSLR